jgi:hypothetical protein
MHQMVMAYPKYINIFQSEAVENLPKLGFFESNPSGNPVLDVFFAAWHKIAF